MVLSKKFLSESLSIMCGIYLAGSCVAPAFADSSKDSYKNGSISAVDDAVSSEKAEKEDKEAPPTSGDVITSNREKRAKANEASTIKEADPGVKPDIVTSSEVKRPTVAIALGGGGARGAAHIGVLKVLKEAGIPVDYIVGNSMGSIVGGFYSAGVPLADIQEMLVDKSLRRAYIGMVPPKILIAPLSKLVSTVSGGKHYAGLWTGDKFDKYIQEHLPNKDMQVQDTKIPFSAVACNLIDGQAYRISEGKLSTAIRASASISPLIQPIAIGDKVFCDGGVRANLPASSARNTGADIVIAVLVDEPLKTIDAKQFKHLTGIAMRLADIILAVSDERQLQFADVIVNPDVSSIDVLSNHPKDVDRAVLAGELAAKKALPDILKMMQNPPKHDSSVAHQNLPNI